MTPAGKEWLQGTLWAPGSGNTRVDIQYNNLWPSNTNALDGRDKLNTALTSGYPTPYYIVGHSMGAQVVYKWLRELGPTSAVSTTTTTFICTGCPERKYGGAAVIQPSKYPAVYPGGSGGVGLPATMRYTLIDIARQYDGWADYPNNDSIAAALTNAQKGQSTIHVDYGDVPWNSGIDYVEGLVTYRWSAPTYPAPSAQVDDTGLNWLWRWLFHIAATTDASVRSAIEAAYSRPVTLPSP